MALTAIVGSALIALLIFGISCNLESSRADDDIEAIWRATRD